MFKEVVKINKNIRGKECFSGVFYPVRTSSPYFSLQFYFMAFRFGPFSSFLSESRSPTSSVTKTT